MLFDSPDYQRVIYTNNPLAEVLCELRFSKPIRAIEGSAHDKFVSALFGEFPHVANLDPPGMPEEEVQAAFRAQIIATLGGQQLQLLSADALWRVLLHEDYLVFSTRHYERWEGFEARLMRVLNACFDAFPGEVAGVSLRYVDVIVPSQLDEAVSFELLIKRELLGVLSEPAFLERASQSRQQLDLRVDERTSLSLRHGLTALSDEQTLAYVIDFQFDEELPDGAGDLQAALTRLHGWSGRAFRWAITERLHEALGPKPIS